MLVTLRHAMQPNFADALEAALRGGARLIQLRENDADARLRDELAQTIAALCAHYGARWLWNGDEATARTLGANGVHWPERDIPLGRIENTSGFLHGASVHSVEAAQRAEAAGADYLVFGSVWETQSHPGGAAAGLAALRAVSAACGIPVFAIGGVTAERAALCREAGAHGVAVMRAVWEAPDIAHATSELLLSLS